MSFRRRTIGAFGTIRIAFRGTAAWASGSARTPTGPTPLPAAAATSTARSMAHEIFCELRQLGAVQLSVMVGIEGQRMGDDSLDRGRSALAAAATASSGSGSTAAGTTRSRTVGSGTASRAVPTRTAALFARSTGTAWSTGTFVLKTASGLFATVSAPATGSARPARWVQFVLAELSIAVLVELLKRDRGVGNLFGRQLTVMIGVEHLHQGIARRSSPATLLGPALGRTLSVVLVIAARGAFGGLRDDDRSAQGTQNSNDPKRATHRTISKLSAITASPQKL
jgi:hypothetical protein